MEEGGHTFSVRRKRRLARDGDTFKIRKETKPSTTTKEMCLKKKKSPRRQHHTPALFTHTERKGQRVHSHGARDRHG